VRAPDMATTAVPGAMWLMLTSRIMGEMYHGAGTLRGWGSFDPVHLVGAAGAVRRR
jgi:hypothetical protein